MLPVCSTSPCCSTHSQIPTQSGIHPFCLFRKQFHVKGAIVHRMSFNTQAAKSFPSFVECSHPSQSQAFVDCPNGSLSVYDMYNHSIGEKLGYAVSYSISAVEDEYDFQPNDNADSGGIASKLPPIEVAPDDPILGSDALEFNYNPLSTVTSRIDDFSAGVKNSLSTATSFVQSITRVAREGVDNALRKLFSAVDQTGERTSNGLTSFANDLNEAIGKAAIRSVDVLRGAIVVVEDSASQGASFIVYSYGSAKELLPPEIKDALDLTEEKASIILRPVGTAFQQVYNVVEALERSLGLDPMDPVVSFVLLLVSSTTLWILYFVWTYGGYSGDLSPQSTIELLTGKDSAILIDVRPEILRERDGIPDLRRGARFRYASVTLPEVDSSLRKLLKGGIDLDDTLIAAVIRNLKVFEDRSKVIVMDGDGTRSKGIARSLRKLGVKQPYLVQGGFESWRKQGVRVKELKPETALTILNEEAEAILEDIRPSPLQALGCGVGLVAALYALIEWEKTLQLIGIVGIGQTIYRRVASYENLEDFKQDVRLLLAPVRLGRQAFSWAAGKLENNRVGLPTSPSSTDVQSRVLQAAAKHESQPTDTEGIQNPSLESASSLKENVDLKEA